MRPTTRSRSTRQRDPEARGRCEVRHDHARRGTRHRVRAQEDVEEPERHDPQHPRRRDLPRADRDLQHPPPGAGLEQADRHRPPRLRRPVPRHRLRLRRPRHAHYELPAEGWRRGPDLRGLPGAGRRRRDGHVQPGRLDPRLRPRQLQLRPGPHLPGVPVDQEHDPQGLRRPVQGPVPGGLRRRVRRQVRRGRHHLRAPAHRRHGRQLAQVGGRLRLGLQELRRRRAVRHRGAGLRPLWV